MTVPDPQKIKFFKVLAGLFLFFMVLEIGFSVLLHYFPLIHTMPSLVRITAWICLATLFVGIVQSLMHGSLFHHATRSFQWLRKSSATFKVHFIAAFMVLISAMYLSTGTLSPYANTVNFPPDYPLVEPKCQYLFNGDYYQFSAVFCFLDGKPRSTWMHSPVLHRILYNCIAYPFMKIFEHDLGGLITNFLLMALAFISFALFALRTNGESGAIAGMWLLALYPGITYYGGQPFLYAIIVPCCLWLYMLLWKMNSCTSVRNVWISALVMGILFLGYDLLVFFGTAAFFLLLFRKKFVQVSVLVPGMLACSALWWCVAHFGLGASFTSENSQAYSIILHSYFQRVDFPQWFALLKNLPENLMHNFFFSTFLFLPVLFSAFIIVGACARQKLLTFPETCLLLGIALVFLFNNCAPPYDFRWQMRGTWIARLYQPLFVIFLFYSARLFQALASEKRYRPLKLFTIVLLIVTVSGNGLVALGPALNDPAGISSWVYWNFYKHSPRQTMKMNLAKYGRRPWGFCQ
jgi:hypothetical protein